MADRQHMRLRRTIRITKNVLIFFLGICSLSLQRANAGQFGFSVGYQGEYTNNVQLTPTNPEEDWINTLFAGLMFTENSADLAANIQAQISYLNYSRGIYEDEIRSDLNAAAIWSIVPKRFLWNFADYLSQYPLSSISAPTPNNLETVNAFTTGPDLIVSIDPVNALVLGLRVGNTWLKEGNTDQNLFGTVLRWRHSIDPISQFSINLLDTKNFYTEDLPVIPNYLLNYLREDLFVRYSRTLLWSNFVVDAGRTRILPEGDVEGVDKPIVRLILTRRASSESTLGLSYRSEVMDLGTALLTNVADPSLPQTITSPPGTSITALATGDIFFIRAGDAFYSFSGKRIGIQTSVFLREYDYRFLHTEDRTESGVYLKLSNILSPTLTANLYGEALRTEYQSITLLTRNINYGLTVTYRISPGLGMDMAISHNGRNSSDPLNSYEATIASVRVTYGTK